MTSKRKSKSSAKSRDVAVPANRLDFLALVASIRQAHEHFLAQASRAVNVSLTMRNWVIGWYIREYEQNGADRAHYGEGLLDTLAERLKGAGMNDLAARTLRQCRQFYTVYPRIWQTVSAESFRTLLPPPIWQTLSAKSGHADIPTAAAKIPGGFRKSAPPEFAASPGKLFTTLSFSHLAELIAIDDPLKRAFYEIECVRGNRSVRQLKRQITTLYFERSGLSKDKEKLAAMVRAGAETAEWGTPLAF